MIHSHKTFKINLLMKLFFKGKFMDKLACKVYGYEIGDGSLRIPSGRDFEDSPNSRVYGASKRHI
jgi:hypothetical protein